MADGRLPSTEHTRILSSSILTALRSSVKKRMWRYTSFRKEVENSGKKKLNGAYTPPPAYSDIKRFSELQVAASDSGIKETSEPDQLSDQGRRSSTASHQSIPSETDNGINWQSANQGISFITLAAKQSTTQRSDEINSAVARPLYVHAMTYLLRGLPIDMNLEEQLSIQAALPSCVAIPTIDVNDKQRASSTASSASAQSSSSPSILHRLLASGIIYLFFFIHATLPYIKACVKSAYRYERQYHLTERLVSGGLTTADGLAKSSIELYGSVSKVGDGRLGQAMDSAIIWCIDGVTGGIHEGVGEGLAIMGARRSSADNPRT